ncbi:MAG: hypothetical protein QOF02_3469 [Blastocatellia bacterium]|jgi:hypothetical protein|nr:hypothetical protein [Blastocatellia bacterium]
MTEAFAEKFQLGARAVSFRQEADGIVALSLFQPRACLEMIESVSGLARWDTAKVGKRGPDGEIRSMVDPQFRTAQVLFTEYLSSIEKRFDAEMNAVLKPLVECLWGRKLTDHEGTQLVRYSPGGHYRAHSDVGRRTRNRHYTVLCYLNDDFAGGRTQFPSLDYFVTPRSGKAIIFPSGYLHCGEPVTSGEKYILVSWITGPIPPD